MAERTGSSKIIWVVFALSVTFGAYELLKPAPTSKKVPEPVEGGAMVARASSQAGKSSKSEHRFGGKRRVPRDTWGRDPFVPMSMPALVVPRSSFIGGSAERPLDVPQDSTASVLRLRAISRRGEETWALINGSVCKVGDIVEGQRVVKISDGRVILVKGKRRTVLRFSGR